MVIEKNNSLEVKAYNELSNSVNTCCFKPDLFAKTWEKDHRYLQSEVFRCALEIIEVAASDDYQYDARNEWCHKIAKDLQKVIEEKY